MKRTLIFIISLLVGQSVVAMDAQIASQEEETAYPKLEFDILSKEGLSFFMKTPKDVSRSIARKMLEGDGIVSYIMNSVHHVKSFDAYPHNNSSILSALIRCNTAKAYFSESGTKIVTTSTTPGIKGGHPGPVRVYDPGSGKLLSTFTVRLFGDNVTKASFSKKEDKVVLLIGNRSKDKFTIVWDAHTGKSIFELIDVNDAQLNNAGNALVVAVKKEVQIWDITTKKKVRSFKGHTDLIKKVSWNSTDDRVISASRDGAARVWDVKTGEELFVLAPQDGPVFYAQCNTDGAVASTITAHYLKTWSLETGECLYMLNLKWNGIFYRLNPQGTFLLSYHYLHNYAIKDSQMMLLELWDLEGNRLFAFKPHGYSKGIATFNQAGDEIKTSTFTGKANILSIDRYFKMKDYLDNIVTVPEAIVLKAISQVRKLRILAYLRTIASDETCLETTDEKKVISSGDLKFDFRKYPHLQPVYDGLREPIKKVLDQYVIRTNSLINFVNGIRW